MFIIYGWGGIAESIGRGTFRCPVCRCQTDYDHKQMRTWIKVFFVPIIPLAPGERFVECSRCRQTFLETVLSMSAPPQGPSPLQIDELVLGKRGDYWYPGTLAAKQFKRFKVNFHDGKQVLLPKEEVISFDLREGDPIFCRREEGAEYRLGTIVDFSEDKILIRFENSPEEWSTLANVRVIWDD